MLRHSDAAFTEKPCFRNHLQRVGQKPSAVRGIQKHDIRLPADFGGSIAVIGPDDVAPILHPAISCIFSDQSDTPPVFVYKNDMRRTAADRFQTEVSGSGK